MRISTLELVIAASALGSLGLLMLAVWWSEQNRQRDQRRRQVEEIETERIIAQQIASHGAEQKASAR